MAELPDQVTVDKIIKIETDDLRVPNRVKFHVSSGGRETVLRFKDRDLDTSTVFERKVQAYLDQWVQIENWGAAYNELLNTAEVVHRF